MMNFCDRRACTLLNCTAIFLRTAYSYVILYIRVTRNVLIDMGLDSDANLVSVNKRVIVVSFCG